MSNGDFNPYRSPAPTVLDEPLEELRPLDSGAYEYPPPRILRPVLLFVATCLSTVFVGWMMFGLGGGLLYSACLLTILLFHEFGHFLQARRYGVYATYPHFIPLPLPPIGTLGAFIAMGARQGDRKALFDIGITGPLAGLVPTLIFCAIGIHMSRQGPMIAGEGVWVFGEPLIFQYLVTAIRGPLPEGWTLFVSPICHAGWVGLLLTALNLIPISQLDGGHILYGLLREKAHTVATVLLAAAVVAVVAFQYYWWTLMLVLLVVIGPKHPPTTDDSVPLGPFRTMLGWLTLSFVILGFTPRPIWMM